MSVIASSDIHNQTDDVLFDKRTFERLQEVDIEDLDYENDSDEDDENDEAILKDSLGEGRKFNSNDRYVHQMKMDAGESEGDEDDDDESEDEAVKRVEAMANDIDTFYSQKKDYKMELNRKVAKREKRQKALVEQQRLKRIDADEEDELNNDDIRRRRSSLGMMSRENNHLTAICRTWGKKKRMLLMTVVVIVGQSRNIQAASSSTHCL